MPTLTEEKRQEVLRKFMRENKEPLDSVTATDLKIFIDETDVGMDFCQTFLNDNASEPCKTNLADDQKTKLFHFIVQARREA